MIKFLAFIIVSISYLTCLLSMLSFMIFGFIYITTENTLCGHISYYSLIAVIIGYLVGHFILWIDDFVNKN